MRDEPFWRIQVGAALRRFRETTLRRHDRGNVGLVRRVVQTCPAVRSQGARKTSPIALAHRMSAAGGGPRDAEPPRSSPFPPIRQLEPDLEIRARRSLVALDAGILPTSPKGRRARPPALQNSRRSGN